MPKKEDTQASAWLYSPLKWIEDGSGYTRIRSPYTPDSIYLRGTMSGRSFGYLTAVSFEDADLDGSLGCC